MFAWKEKKIIQTQIQRLTDGESDITGANRRAIGLVPLVGGNREIYQCGKIKYHQLLLSLEAKQTTCCLRITNPRLKSRCAILLYKGRVLGCVYGNKQLDSQVFSTVGREFAISDMAAPDTILDVYILSEELSLAAGSLFHSHTMPISPGEAPLKLLQRAMYELLSTKSPGCVVVNNTDGLAVAMIYIFGGSIVGIYSYQDGWLENSYECAENIVTTTAGAQVVASSLAANNIDEVIELTFGLTGLNERKPQAQDEVVEAVQQDAEHNNTLMHKPSHRPPPSEKTIEHAADVVVDRPTTDQSVPSPDAVSKCQSEALPQREPQKSATVQDSEKAEQESPAPKRDRSQYDSQTGIQSLILRRMPLVCSK